MSQLVSYNENHFVFLFIVLKSLKQRCFVGNENKSNKCNSSRVKIQGDRVDYQSNQTLLHHYMHVKTIQSICSIHQIILEIHLILESHDLKGLAHS